MPTRKRRVAVTWIAAALVVGFGGAALATTSSGAGDDGLVLDGVTAVSVRVGDSSKQAAFAHNAFAFSDDSLGGTGAIAGDVVATMSDGSRRETPFHVGSSADVHASP